MVQRSLRTPPSTLSSVLRSPRLPPSPSRPSVPTLPRWPTPSFRFPRTSVWVLLPSVLPVPVSVSVWSSPPSSTPSPVTPLSVASFSPTPFLVSPSSRPSVYVFSVAGLLHHRIPKGDAFRRSPQNFPRTGPLTLQTTAFRPHGCHDGQVLVKMCTPLPFLRWRWMPGDGRQSSALL
jgi:hypothetical protein